MIKLKNIKPDIRDLKDMKEVVYDKKWLKNAPEDLELYYVYRGVKKKDGLRYDITIIPPKMLGKEFVKTAGHHHSGKYQEIYTVLKGKAIFLLQKSKGKIIEDIYTVKAEKGEVIIIPLDYGHLTINAGKQELILANWVWEKCQNIYNLFRKMKGAGYFYTKGPAKGEVNWKKNKNYKKIPKLHFKKPIKADVAELADAQRSGRCPA